MDNFLEKFDCEWEVNWLKAALLAPESKRETMWGMTHEHEGRKSGEASLLMGLLQVGVFPGGGVGVFGES